MIAQRAGIAAVELARQSSRLELDEIGVVLLPLGSALCYAARFDWKIFPADVAAKKSYLAAEYAPGAATSH